MVNVTERAKQELRKLLSQKVDWPETRLRLMDRGQGTIGLGIEPLTSKGLLLSIQNSRIPLQAILKPY